MRQCLLLVCLLGSPGLIQAQQDEVQAGTRIRLRRVLASGGSGPWIQGTVSQVRGDSMLFRPERGGEERLVLRDAAMPLLVFAGRRSNLRRGLAIGLGTGAVGGALLGLASGEDCGSGGEFICFDRGTMAAAGAIVVGGIGAATGLIVGALSSHDVWKPAVSGPALHPFAGRAAGRLIIGGSVSF